jgi:hypothetical protein
VRRWLRAGHAPTWRHADHGRSILDSLALRSLVCTIRS